MAGPDNIAGLSGPVRSELTPQLKGVVAPPGRSDEGDVNAATDGSLVPPGVSGAPGAPKDCSKGLGSRLRDPAGCPEKVSDAVPVGLIGGGAKGSTGFVTSEASVGLSEFTSGLSCDDKSVRVGDVFFDVCGDLESPRAEEAVALLAIVWAVVCCVVSSMM